MARTPPLLIAHRGESFDAPENTLAAVRLAWERGAAAVEVDARLSSDGILVVSHDPDTQRIGGPRRPIRRQSAAELRAVDAGIWKGREWAGEGIPLLREVIATVPAGSRLFIEMKEGPETIPALAADLHAAKLADRQVIVMGFIATTVATAAQALRGVEICQLLRARDYLAPTALARAIAGAQERGCHSVDVEHHRSLDARIIENVHAAGLAIYVWTVNRVPTARRLAAAGIDGITTDRCAWMREQLAR